MSALREYGERGLHTGVDTLGGFRKFILRGNVVDLAVGVVIGIAFSGLVQGFVNDFINPLIALFGGGSKDLNSITAGPFRVGNFINLVISFLIIAAVVYFFVVLPVTKLQDRFAEKKPAAPPTTRECPFCLSTVPLKATRCAYCTAQLPPAETPAAESASRG